MKIFLNKFVLSVFFIIFALIWYQIYKIDNIFSYKDTNSYFYIVKGNWYINISWQKKILNVSSQKQILTSWNIVWTIWKDSLWVIEWWDNSITRIWWNSKLEIKEAQIKNDLSVMKIRFRLLEWKSWSNVVSMFSSDSYFNEEFDEIIAWVRGTVFEVNLDNNYVYVKNHEVLLENTKNNTSNILKQGEFFSLDFFKKIDEKLKDALWQELNENIDKNYLINLRNKTNDFIGAKVKNFNLNNYFDDKYKVLYELSKSGVDTEKIKDIISKMSDEDKNKLYYMLMFDYQRLNIVSANDNLFEKKMLYRDILMLLASDEEKKTILKYSFYDLNDALSQSWSNLSLLTGFISQNKDLISKLWIDTDNVDFSSLSQDKLKEIMWKNFNDIKNIFKIEEISNLNKWNIKDSINNINNEAHNKVNQTLNDIYNFIKK